MRVRPRRASRCGRGKERVTAAKRKQARPAQPARLPLDLLASPTQRTRALSRGKAMHLSCNRRAGSEGESLVLATLTNRVALTVDDCGRSAMSAYTGLWSEPV